MQAMVLYMVSNMDQLFCEICNSNHNTCGMQHQNTFWGKLHTTYFLYIFRYTRKKIEEAKPSSFGDKRLKFYFGKDEGNIWYFYHLPKNWTRHMSKVKKSTFEKSELWTMI